ncbi:CCA tRNA nucleotidyltransferase [Aliishimia ponticola]|uniref:CCA tRNA nucleotidyltransferase n=1 Tax=Aliishimia ponticola TaxID=2499833 RepID=A0A4V3XJW5_9RHOB|nr:CCA tRNA nucleotidyltransferase [Aliishimia ponticola]THH34663.1 CCA tRNA nucleotidyltransferase [Aliishimia ponticola]
MKLTGDWLTRRETRQLFDLYAAARYELFAVGGCVRAELMGEPVSDIDMASNAPPETAMAFLRAAGLKVIPTGIDHGTITAVVANTPFEITTYRRDVETDGRRAVVAFSDRLEDDAQRRDFTMNALYAAADGTITDPVGGLPDLQARRVRFIGNAVDRIREDYLRTLRFFRFSARYANSENGFDAEALAAIAENISGLNSLSRERVTTELLKLLKARDPLRAVMTMTRIGVTAQILPGCDPTPFGPYLHFEDRLGIAPHPVHRLAALISEDVAETLRLSRAQMRELAGLRRLATGTCSIGELGYRLGAEDGRVAFALRCAFLELVPAGNATVAIDKGARAKFPISASDLIDSYSGQELGDQLKSLEQRWIESEFKLTREELLQ